MFDPFDVWGLIKGNDKKTQFWDMTDEELERARLTKKQNKRGILVGVLDPLRLWGEKGYIRKHFVRRKGAGAQMEQVQDQVVKVEASKAPGQVRTVDV